MPELLDDARDLVDVAAVGRRPRRHCTPYTGPRSPFGAAHSFQIVTSRSCSQRALPSPRRNQSSSRMIERRCTFFVVTSGKPSLRSKRIWWPNTLFVPVPVRSPLVTPWSRTWRMKSSYWERRGGGLVMRAIIDVPMCGHALPSRGRSVGSRGRVARPGATSAVRLAARADSPALLGAGARRGTRYAPSSLRSNMRRVRRTKRALERVRPRRPALLGASHAPGRAPDHGFDNRRARRRAGAHRWLEAGAGYPPACVGGAEQRRARGRARAARASCI